eukprot:TRINITY_DN6418_c0_g1_i1.p1 TRINITY_DN6418_c0_g1~~TRINITY_DN6418_c0_g1_i1.p1  ORF type:complete len:204 (-),score=33.82 TRINITY_DN6418_c0_g1_i1:104-715(-)
MWEVLDDFAHWLWETSLEIFRSLGVLGRKNAKICFLGLDNAGKTTLLHMLMDDRLSINQPTVHPNALDLNIRGIHFRTYDLGGHETARRIWGDYLPNVDAIIFMVDAADRTRFAEAREELEKLMELRSLALVPIVVLGNKIDIPTAASEYELLMNLGLYNQTYWDGRCADKFGRPVRPVKLFMCSVVKRMGYAEAFDWLAELL